MVLNLIYIYLYNRHTTVHTILLNVISGRLFAELIAIDADKWFDRAMRFADRIFIGDPSVIPMQIQGDCWLDVNLSIVWDMAKSCLCEICIEHWLSKIRISKNMITDNNLDFEKYRRFFSSAEEVCHKYPKLK